jgi:hypothetical protein
MWLLPRRDVVRHGSGTHGLLRSAADVSVEAGTEILGLRQPASGDRDEGARVDTPSLRSRSEASGHDHYIGRMGAVAIQPDGTRALLSNIDADDNERARFWSLVEEHEAVNQGDKMSLRIADNPKFWLATAAHPNCPPELKAALNTASPNDPIQFEIASGKEMRAFLATQSGWCPRRRVERRKAVPSRSPNFMMVEAVAPSIESSASCRTNSIPQAASAFCVSSRSSSPSASCRSWQ